MNLQNLMELDEMFSELVKCLPPSLSLRYVTLFPSSTLDSIKASPHFLSLFRLSLSLTPIGRGIQTEDAGTIRSNLGIHSDERQSSSTLRIPRSHCRLLLSPYSAFISHPPSHIPFTSIECSCSIGSTSPYITSPSIPTPTPGSARWEGTIVCCPPPPERV